jgi:hypothetical protein
MSWRVAKSLDKLLAEINARSPKRSKLSDGGIGDAAHASRDSDHNPWVKDGAMGVVTARDFTDDPTDGFDASNFANWLRERCKSGAERRVKYIISDRRICSGDRDNWAWRTYTGANAHTKHVHVSVLSAKGRYDDDRSWGWHQEVKTPAPQGLESKVTLSAPAAEFLAATTGTPRKEGDVLSLRYIVDHLGKS